MKQWIDQLFETGILSGEQLLQLLEHVDEENSSYLFEKARIRQKEHFDHKVYTLSLIHICKFPNINMPSSGAMEGKSRQVNRITTIGNMIFSFLVTTRN